MFRSYLLACAVFTACSTAPSHDPGTVDAAKGGSRASGGRGGTQGADASGGRGGAQGADASGGTGGAQGADANGGNAGAQGADASGGAGPSQRDASFSDAAFFDAGSSGSAGPGPGVADGAAEASDSGGGSVGLDANGPSGGPLTYAHGINLGNRLEGPTEGAWGAFLDAKDFMMIAQRGFDHVRLPIRFSGHASATAPYTIDAAFFQRVDWAIEQAQKNKLSLVLDLHAYDELMVTPADHSARFLGLWEQIASRYKDYPDSLAFELLNEPSRGMDTQWNALFLQAIALVRKTNPKRVIVVDAVFWADPLHLSSLVLPNDPNVWAAFHAYEPKMFSFQGKSWMGPEYMTTGIVFPGPPPKPVVPVAAAQAAPWAAQWFADYNSLPAAQNPSGPKAIQDQVDKALAFSRASGHPVYNNEWGPQDGAQIADRAALMRAMREACERAAIRWAIWEDPVNMKLFDNAQGTWVEPLIAALLPAR